jgi:hypothetical protein
VLDGLGDLRGDRDEKVDLSPGERPRLARADVERALQLLLRPVREDRHGEDRLVVVLAQVGEALEARVEVRLGRDHHRRPLGRGGAGDALARTHVRPFRVALDGGPVRGAQHELVGALVVEVDEARVGAERRGHLVRDRLHHLLQLEAGVDDLDRAGEQREMPGRRVHQST